MLFLLLVTDLDITSLKSTFKDFSVWILTCFVFGCKILILSAVKVHYSLNTHIILHTDTRILYIHKSRTVNMS